MTGLQSDDLPESSIAALIKNGRIACRDVFEWVYAGGSLKKATQYAVVNHIKWSHCQLGLFGTRPAENTQESEPLEIQNKIIALSDEGRISCALAWDVADEFGVPKKYIGMVCNRMNIKIKGCQLGAFR